MDPNIGDKAFELPVVAINSFNIVPLKTKGWSDLCFLNKVGICGISTFSSAFHFTFNPEHAILLHCQCKKIFGMSIHSCILNKQEECCIEICE